MMKVSSHGIALIMNFEYLRTAQSICEYLGYEYAIK